MNIKRRKEIGKIITILEEARKQISNLREEEENAYNNMPEVFQDERGDDMQAACDALENADDGFDDIISFLEEAKSY